jgi:leucyl-tRNA synthetase
MGYWGTGNLIRYQLQISKSMAVYKHKTIEKKWQKSWEKQGLFRAEDGSAKPKYYCLIEFPYPSGAGLHVGHVRSQTALDIIARKKRMDGFNVLYPIGWDAFGLPTENFAIKTGKHPTVVTKENIAVFKKQIKSLGISFDWSREISTTDPAYYKWTQWIFLKLFEKGLAYKKEMPINWCPKCKIGLANEEVIDGKCERCGTQSERRVMAQWMLKITEYADRLIEDLETVDYLEKIKTQQINWIGRSYGAEIKFEVKSQKSKVLEDITVFTTRPDTIFGATFLVLSPEHELVNKITTTQHEAEVLKYQDEARKKSELERTQLQKEKTGVFTGASAINPMTGKEIPIFIADYVLTSYGTGAIMAVPAHDERDFEFAKKYELPIVPVIVPNLGEKVSGAKIDKMFSVLDQINQKLSEQKIKVWFNGTFGVSGYCGFVFNDPRDVDCGVLEKDFDKAREIIESLGYKKLEDKENPKFKVSIYNAGDFTLEIGTFDHDLGDEIITLEGHEFRVPEAGWLAECYRITAPKERRKGKNDLDRARFLEAISSSMQGAFTEVENGKMINSSEYDGLSVIEATDRIIIKLEAQNAGKKMTQYHLRDWVFSRQHYWGEPIPIVYCEKCGTVPLTEKDLPLKLPMVEKYEPTDNGESPLAAITEWVNTKCPTCGGSARRETDTMPNWAGSSWYFLAYVFSQKLKVKSQKFRNIFDESKEQLDYWLPVDLYNGGMEHTTLHLLYSRFWNKFLYDIGVVPVSEPYQRRVSHGMILAPDGQKMSKSRGNVINPDELVQEFGADVVRMYEMFMGPYDQSVSWDINGVRGIRRFIEKIWNLEKFVDDENSEVTSLLHKTIKKVTEDIEERRFNTAVSAMMIFVNKILEVGCSKQTFKMFLQLLSPFAPHLAEELWTKMGEENSIFLTTWPKYLDNLLVDATIEVVVQVNGKLRDKLMVAPDISEEEIRKLALASEKVQAFLQGNEPKKVIYVRGKLVSVVV